MANKTVKFTHINAYDKDGKVFVVIETETNESIFINKKLLDYVFTNDIRKVKPKDGSNKTE